ncbi:MAG: TrbG/VirB9 family P-type conjugative transfer protein [Pseudomonadota bacterium]|nr:TrbG/VirB9 family P-type conjugative transfer protein [Pseudomonadota bacterium]
MRNSAYMLAGLLWATAAGAAYDFDYRTVGDMDARPANVFDDGASTYFQFAPGRPVPAILKVGPAGEQLAAWRLDGPYIVVDGVLPDWRFRLGRGIAAVRYAGSRPLGLKGVLYGAAVPISESGPVATMATPVPTQVQQPPQPVRAVTSAVPEPKLPEFSGSFVVQFLPAEISAMQPQGRGEYPAPAPAGMSRNTRKLSVRFGGNAVQASHADRAKIRAAAQSAVAADTLAIRAFSGAADADTRKRYVARRAENVKAALVAAGVPEAKIRLVYGATDRVFAPKAEIEFIRDGSRAGQPRPLLTQAPSPAQEVNPDGRVIRASMQVDVGAPVVGGLVIRRLALSLGGIDIGHADRATIARSLADAASCDTLIVRGYSDLPDPEARMKDANLRARKAVAALVAEGVPEEKIRFAPVSLAPKASSPRADIVFIRNGTGAAEPLAAPLPYGTGVPFTGMLV